MKKQPSKRRVKSTARYVIDYPSDTYLIVADYCTIVDSGKVTQEKFDRLVKKRKRLVIGTA